jgi:hypothetical protein
MSKKMETVKPGYKTTEFWLSTAVIAAGVALASGAVNDGLAAQIVGGVMSVLNGIGYTWSRATAKVAPKVDTPK